ncbi:MAG: T9SS type A sorting domain-containing protein [Lentimicrobium sp.]|nr:T9SS type A sorting domain-containing protein [Lentimicrobium sp.]
MMKFLLALILLPLLLHAQDGEYTPKQVQLRYPELQPMSAYDSMMLSRLPEFVPENNTLRRLLPFSVDNSVLPWFRPLVAQVGLECGQASSIGVMFTYEMANARQLPANVPENQYTTHFTYSFINGGSNAGVNYYESFEIIKKAGNPTIADYGGMAPGGPSMWMNGYAKYYNALHNRVDEVYSVKVNTAEGIQTLKNWIYDHANGSSAGGLGCFYGQYSNPPMVLPPGTPEAGKHVIPSWGSSANHAMTICGYNDSIRWDYNGDGQYTNHIDLNGDGIIDVRDWEIGGFKMANTYGSISGWGDQGFAYMMYKSVADPFQQGGIWNNSVVIVDVKDEYQPQLTAKISMSYYCRNKLKVTVGVSSDPAATQPEYIMHFPVFDFQGGCLPMQGNGFPEIIEFGLDLNPILVHLEPEVEARFFLRIEENDPLNEGTGILTGFSLMDYTQGVTEINSMVTNIPIVNNGITSVNLNASINFDPALIVTENLPPLQLYGNYSAELQAQGGTPPYKWSIAEDYSRFDSVATMQNITAQKLTLSSNSNGKAQVNLPFAFPYFGNEYEVVYATADGYLIFENTLIPWPFYIEGRTYFIDNPMIAPSMSNPYIITPAEGDGVWYEASEDYVTFRWKMSIYQTAGTINSTARLFRDGRIELNFGEFSAPSYIERYTGISAGDGENYYLLSHNPDFSPALDQLVRYSPLALHKGIDLTENGLLTGTAVEMSEDIPLRFCVSDKNNLKSYKTLIISTEGLQMEYEINSGDDSVIEFGETFTIDLQITNHNSFPIQETTFSLTTIDTNFEVLDGLSSISGLLPGESISVKDAFMVLTGNFVPDDHEGIFTISASSAEGNWARTISLTGHSPVIDFSNLQIVDGNNGILEPGESAILQIGITNTGGAKLLNAVASLQSWDPYLTITEVNHSCDTLSPDEEWSITYNIALAPAAPLYHTLLLNVQVLGDNEFNFIKTIPLLTGFIIEDFETGSMFTYDWQTGGNTKWYIEGESAWEGNYCARSGSIVDNQNSNLWLEWNVAYADSISFWYKVSSEANYDYLYFFCGEQEKGKWAGEVPWSFAKFPVNSGNQIFSWRYKKDVSVSTGEDCARIDYIMLPVFEVPTAVPETETILSIFSVYPNPFTEDFTISYGLMQSSHVNVLVSDAKGRILYQHSPPTPLPKGIHQLKPGLNLEAPGTYLIILQTDTGRYVKKLIRTGRSKAGVN